MPHTHGSTKILVNTEGSTFKCPRPSCEYTSTNPQGVVIHLVRHCVKSEPAPESALDQLVALASVVPVPEEVVEESEEEIL